MHKRIMVVLDDSDASLFAVHEGIEMARAHGSEILFFYVLPTDVPPMVGLIPVPTLTAEEFRRQASEDASHLLGAASAVAEQAGVYSIRAMGSGVDDAQCVAEAARNRHCTLIVVATEKHNAVMRLLNGSIVPGLITHASLPVLVCRSDPDLTKHSRAFAVAHRLRKAKAQR